MRVSALVQFSRRPGGDARHFALCYAANATFQMACTLLATVTWSRMVERGLPMAHTTIMRWVHRYVPEFERRWNRVARPVGHSWRVDETYVRIRGEWAYLYRAVDCDGNTVDFRLNTRRDVAAAKAFFRKAIKRQG